MWILAYHAMTPRRRSPKDPFIVRSIRIPRVIRYTLRAAVVGDGGGADRTDRDGVGTDHENVMIRLPGPERAIAILKKEGLHPELETG
jgi:hypothetical protein